MKEKQCSICGQTKSIEEFYNSKDENAEDNKGKICKECSKSYYHKHRQNMIDKYGEEEYRRMQWEKKLRASAKKAGISLNNTIDIEKISKLRIRLVDYPDKGLPLSLNHIEFMNKYNLTVEEYLYFREQIINGKFEVLNRNI